MLEQRYVDELTAAIQQFLGHMRWKRHLFGVLSNGFTVFAVVLSLAITVAGLYETGKLPGVLGGILTALLILNRTYPFDDISYFYQAACADAENLFFPIPPIDEASYAQMRRDFNSLRDAVAKNVPRKKNLEGVSAMREEVSAANVQPVRTTTPTPLSKPGE